MQGLVLQLTRAGFLMLLWVFIWSVLRILKTDIYAPTGAVMVRRGLALRGTLLPSRQRRHVCPDRGGGPGEMGVNPGHLRQTIEPIGNCRKSFRQKARVRAALAEPISAIDAMTPIFRRSILKTPGYNLPISRCRPTTRN